MNSQRRNNKKRKKDGNSLFNRLLLVGSLLIGVFFLINTFRSIQLTIEKLEILDQAKEDVETLRLKNLELLLESELVKTDFFVELQGRDRLHLSQDGEIVVIIPEELLTSHQLEEYYLTFVPQEEVVQRPAGFKGWIEFFTAGV